MQTIDVELKKGLCRRQTFSLNGIWQVYGAAREALIQDIPEHFENTVPVPGLLDLATRPVKEPAAWYKRTFRIRGDITENVILKINKAFWGKSIYLNGAHICDHQPNFTPAYVNLKDFVKEGENTLLVRIGDIDSQTVEQGHVLGIDCEKFEYIPGIYDDVSLYFCGNPLIRYIQAAPDTEKGVLTLQLTLSNTGSEEVTDVPVYRVCDAEHKIVLQGSFEQVTIKPGKTVRTKVTIPFAEAHLWTPEDPYLYTVTAATAADELCTRFGMRSVWFDEETKLPMLNGKVYYWRGTNITMYRFFEDPDRGLLPWDREWAKAVLASFKKTNMNSIRFCIGFPPQMWYDLADEMGFLVQDEYPIWGEVDLDNVTHSNVPHWGNRAPAVTHTLRPELIDWQNEHANHPCVAIWDIQNETDSDMTEILIRQLRDERIDLSNRPYDNGWGRPVSAADTMECHPYIFLESDMTWNKANRTNRDPAAKTPHFFNYCHSVDLDRLPKNPRITNEYCWFWLNRDNSPTKLTKDLYNNLIPDATPEERRVYHDLSIAKLTEFWRSSRTTACLLYFCGLSYSKPGLGFTCDEFQPDIAHPTCSETYVKYMHDAMAPLGICIDDISDRYLPGKKELDIVLVNDLEEDWTGDILLELTVDGKIELSKTIPGSVSGFGRAVLPIQLDIPELLEKKGELTASYMDQTGERIYSRRPFTISYDLRDDGKPVNMNGTWMLEE